MRSFKFSPEALAIAVLLELMHSTFSPVPPVLEVLGNNTILFLEKIYSFNRHLLSTQHMLDIGLAAAISRWMRYKIGPSGSCKEEKEKKKIFFFISTIWFLWSVVLYPSSEHQDLWYSHCLVYYQQSCLIINKPKRTQNWLCKRKVLDKGKETSSKRATHETMRNANHPSV